MTTWWTDLKYGITLAYDRGGIDRAMILAVVTGSPLVILAVATGLALHLLG